MEMKDNEIAHLKSKIDELYDKIDVLTNDIVAKDEFILKLAAENKDLQAQLDNFSKIDTKLAQELTVEENIVIQILKEHNRIINYKKLHSLSEEKFEGLRLILKKMKEKGLIDYEGVVPGFSADIKLLRDI